MKFQWDADKSGWNLRARGSDFAYASRISDGPVLVEEDVPRDDGERRMRATGAVDGIVLRVVYVDRPGPGGETVRRIISARRANRKERLAHHERA